MSKFGILLFLSFFLFQLFSFPFFSVREIANDINRYVKKLQMKRFLKKKLKKSKACLNKNFQNFL